MGNVKKLFRQIRLGILSFEMDCYHTLWYRRIDFEYHILRKPFDECMSKYYDWSIKWFNRVSKSISVEELHEIVRRNTYKHN